MPTINENTTEPANLTDCDKLLEDQQSPVKLRADDADNEQNRLLEANPTAPAYVMTATANDNDTDTNYTNLQTETNYVNLQV